MNFDNNILYRGQIWTPDMDTRHTLSLWQRVLRNKRWGGFDPGHWALFPDNVPSPQQLPGQLCVRPCGGGEDRDCKGPSHSAGTLHRDIPVFHRVGHQRHGENRTGNRHGTYCHVLESFIFILKHFKIYWYNCIPWK